MACVNRNGRGTMKHLRTVSKRLPAAAQEDPWQAWYDFWAWFTFGAEFVTFFVQVKLSIFTKAQTL